MSCRGQYRGVVLYMGKEHSRSRPHKKYPKESQENFPEASVPKKGKIVPKRDPKDRKPPKPRITFTKKDFLYLTASRILKSVTQSLGSIKTLCYNSSYSNKPTLIALVTESCKNLRVLQEVIRRADIKERVEGMLLVVLLQDYFGERLECGDELKGVVMKHKTRLHGEWVKAKLRLCTRDEKEEVVLKRYARVNTIKTTTKVVLEQMKELATVESLIPDLLVLTEGFPMNHPLIQQGHLIIQDKASCLPPYILNPTKDDILIDACSAPGNKTTFASALMHNQGTIYAFERDKLRFKTLEDTLSKAGCKNVKAKCKDFLTVKPEEHGDVTMIMVDPSCSGSGMPLHLERSVSMQDQGDEEGRLKKLSNFQQMILKHAMRFPSCVKIVYSTCSIHDMENELVVQSVLNDSVQGKRWQLSKHILPQWSRRGSLAFNFGEDVIRADAREDECHGFFVALFERVSSGDPK